MSVMFDDMRGVVEGLNTATQAAQPPVQDVVMPDSDFAVVGGQVFVASKTGLPLASLLKEIKKFYEGRVEEVRKQAGDKMFGEVWEDWNKQLRHLELYKQGNTAIIPVALHNKTVMFYMGEVGEVRVVRYNPWEMVGSVGQLWDYCLRNGQPRKECGKLIERLRGMERDKKVRVVLEQDKVDWDMEFMFLPRGKKIWNPGDWRTFHTMGDGRLCTGNNPPEVFWAAEDFEGEVNKINLFSLAASSIMSRGEVVPRVVDIKDLLRDSFVVGLEEEGERKWRV